MISIPPYFEYYSDVVLPHDDGAPAISHIAITENVVIVILCYLVGACDGAVGVPCIDTRMGGNDHVYLISLLPGIC